ncbi:MULTISPECIES: DUF6632 domain-containing protein [Burkholderia]|uniref:DUF4345 domain-containing protein n=1 Tax=Burkholderia savannae TaxID=1637837 RepID=A0ABR5T824_9BURK|nr:MULTISPECIES: DUF6632 domain-containing protein [Burkholderia]AOJ73188.1 hypothetical protein WS78_23560 [Burkholderia savannae]KVG38254.1 hypothetical protein WS77_21365 [Burkholderia sp. MSMB0265]KVG81357.1 hypothetical protein WS81_11590 [Burkholderia sp. MSMB2040]KVG91854.1 hypothetical protein WS82_13620 [Burkholderia sp. MSMB2041]KVG94347.1 hypothetical protein WS83_07145 [Burkholderia sp. MSMB2042]
MPSTSTRQHDRPQASPWLSLITRLLGAAFVLFFGAAIVTILLGIDHQIAGDPIGLLVMRLVRWGGVHGGGEHYELMISTVYVVWGIFLWEAANDPFEHRLFLDFTVVANAAHFGLMFVQGLMMPGELIHLVGDVALGWFALALFAATWIPARSKAAKRQIAKVGR